MKRRDFLKKSGLGLASIPFLSIATANSLFASDTFSDYKAIVIVQLGGGNDAFNTFVPTKPTQHTDYKDKRKRIAIENIDLLDDATYEKDANGYYAPSSKSHNPYMATAPANPSETDPNDNLEASYRKGVYKVPNSSLGINAMMPEIAALYEKGLLSIVSNIGPLVEPTTKTTVANGTANLPLFLFAHDHQKRALDTAKADEKISNGWLGRVADSWSPVNDAVGLNISFSGMNTMMVGKKTAPTILGNSPSYYKDNNAKDTTILHVIEKFSSLESNNIFTSLYNRMNKDAKAFSDTFQSAWNDVPDFSTFSAKNSYGESLFSIPNTHDIGLEEIHTLNSNIFKDLETTAKMIKIGKNSFGFKRQVFYVSIGGFDFHSGQPADHTQRLRSISLAISDFYKAIEEMGLNENIVLATTSSFGRTLLSNGDGTDHGWGGHSMILSGSSSFNGGQELGDEITDYKLTSESFYPQRKNKGRLIPTTSVEQMFAPVLDWFGVDESTMANAFPNLVNFRTERGEYKSAFLRNVFS
jgi:uncharacterized protein (DUF1501 family)